MAYSVRVLGAATLLVAALLTATRADATIDATGRWVIHRDDPDFFPPVVENWVQTGSSLSTDTGYAGTIDPDSGVYSLTGPPPGFCGQDTRNGTVAQDGMTLSGTAVLHPLYTPSTCFFGFFLHEMGSRCPDGIVEPGEQCDDGNADPGDGCDGTCAVETCYECSGAPSVCTPQAPGTPCPDDGVGCTEDACDASPACVHTPMAAACDDGVGCTADQCDPHLDCLHTPMSAACDDGQACTVDHCDPTLGCVNTPDVRSCRHAGSSTLRVTDSADDTRDGLAWTWTKGQSTDVSELADPRATAAYTFCLFAGNASAAAGEAVIPPDAARWRKTTNGFRYMDRDRAADGIGVVALVAGNENHAKIVLKGGGAALSVASPPMDLPLTVQLRNGDTDVCWSTTYDSSEITRNEPGKLTARAP